MDAMTWGDNFSLDDPEKLEKERRREEKRKKKAKREKKEKRRAEQAEAEQAELAEVEQAESALKARESQEKNDAAVKLQAIVRRNDAKRAVSEKREALAKVREGCVPSAFVFFS
jgi:hypothetical protein